MNAEFILTAGEDKFLSLWDCEDLSLLSRLDRDFGRLRAVDCSEDGALVATTNHTGTVAIWRLESPTKIHFDRILGNAETSKRAVRLSPSGDKLAVSSPSAITMFPIDPDKPVKRIPIGDRVPTSISWSADGTNLLFTSRRGEIGAIEINTSQLTIEHVRDAANIDCSASSGMTAWISDGTEIVVSRILGNKTSQPANKKRERHADSATEPKRVFISYQRGDAPGEAGRLQEGLKHNLVDGEIFFDVDSVAIASDIRVAIQRAVASSFTVLFIIGPRFDWPRLQNDDDYVRLELLQALEFGKPIVPVLVSDASMPDPRLVPDQFAFLCDLNAVRLRHESWSADFDRLVRWLESSS